jgi:hypothetical protein
MSNMSYCRWENTANDLQDCFNSLSEEGNIAEWYENLNSYEQQGFRNVMSLVNEFTREVAVEVESAGIKY